ncbi:MAG: DUF342 domain-containing protein [Deltaproteobacteria bacterium]|nr:DUF342 domain-containing protein [Deltaproteobacteria bacterium]
MKYRVRIKSKNRKDALAEGAERLGVEPSKVIILEEANENYLVSTIDAPGEYDIEIHDDKMAAILRVIYPPTGTGAPATVEDIEKELSSLGISHGIEHVLIHAAINEVNETGRSQGNITIAKGTPPRKGENARVDVKIGKDAPNKDPKASVMVKPGQVIAIKIPATSGAPGKNIFGEDIPAVPGDDISFAAGENVTINKNGADYVALCYGAARATWQGVSVTDYVSVSKDRMYAEMSLFPVLFDNSRLTPDDIADILKNKGVKHGINTAAIKAVLDKGAPVERFRVAEATPVINGRDSKMEFIFRVNGLDPEEAAKNRAEGVLPAVETRDIVLGGEILARKIPPVKQADGKTITGEIISAIKPEGRKIRAGDNVDAGDNGHLFVVSEGVTAGYADYSGETISVMKLLEISEDRLSAGIALYAPCSMKRVITIDLIKEILERAGIRYGIDLGEIEGFLASEGKKVFPPKRIVIAKGTAPVHGEDARINLSFSMERQAGHIDGKTGLMDFREQSLIHNVKKGDTLTEKIPFLSGTNGKDIFGDVIPASHGKDCKLSPGKNVIISPDGLKLISDMNGMVILDGSRISVTRSHEIKGDIDMSTGNITMDGSLIIQGWVCTGFVVRASGAIHVAKGVDQSVVEAGAGLFIRGGIIGGEDVNIISGGDLTALFIEKAKVHAKGDIIVHNDILNSSVSTGGGIDATNGKGRIIGGLVAALSEIKANETGSPAGIKTNIIIGFDPEQTKREEKIKRHLESFRSQKVKIDQALVRFRNQKGQAEIPRSMRFKLDKLIKQRRNIAQMEAKLNSYMEELKQKESEAKDNPPTLIVNRMVFAGTKINIKGSVMDVETDMPGKIKFYLDDNRKITFI